MNSLWAALGSVFVIVFLIFFFSLSGTDNSTSVWIAFGGILLSYAALLCTPLMVSKSKAAADYRRPLFVASLGYFIVSFIVGIIVMIAQPEADRAVLLTYIALLAIYAVILLVNLLANEHTASQERTREVELKYVKAAAARLKLLMDATKDKTLSKKIEEAYDLISTSPSKSSPSVKSLEDSIFHILSDIEVLNPIKDGDSIMQSIERIISLATKRNSILRTEY